MIVTKDQVKRAAMAVKEYEAVKKEIKGCCGRSIFYMPNELLEAAAAAVGATVAVTPHDEMLCYSFFYEGVEFFDLRDVPEPEPEEDDEEPAPIIDPYDLYNDR